MQEKVLHYLWKYSLFERLHAVTTDGERVEVFAPGTHNVDSGGPDFLNAHLKIGATHWYGHVELHFKSSDWDAHAHCNNKSYNAVALHVVWVHDKEVFVESGRTLACFVLRDKVPPKILKYIDRFSSSRDVIACKELVADVPVLNRNFFLERLLIERMDRKKNILKSDFERLHKNWDQLSLLCIAKSMGLRHNSLAFERLITSFPLDVLYQNNDDITMLEALLFGQAGFLEAEFVDKYAVELKSTYCFLQKKHALSPMTQAEWQWFRLRPVSFPMQRIAQLAAFLHNRQHFFSALLALQKPTDFYEYFYVTVSEYWRNHRYFDDADGGRTHSMSKAFIDKIVINVVVPILFLRSEYHGDFDLKEKALSLLLKIKSEENQILKAWKKVGLHAGNASEAQSLIELHNEFCSRKKCLNCGIGLSIFKNAGHYVGKIQKEY